MLPVGKMRHFWRIFKHCIIAAQERDQLMKLRIEDDTVWTHLLKSLTFEFSRQIFIVLDSTNKTASIKFPLVIWEF